MCAESFRFQFVLSCVLFSSTTNNVLIFSCLRFGCCCTCFPSTHHHSRNMNFKILLMTIVVAHQVVCLSLGKSKEIISLVLLLEGTKSRIFAVLYLVNFVSFVEAALDATQRLQGQFLRGGLVIPSDSLCAGCY